MSSQKTQSIEEFLALIPDADNMSAADLIDYFVYFHTTHLGNTSLKPSDVTAYFDELGLSPYSNPSTYLSRNAAKKKGTKPKFLKKSIGYVLERSRETEIARALNSSPGKVETSHLLRDLLNKIGDKNENAFLEEAVKCYESGCKRAAIVLVWLLTVDHIQKYIYKKERIAFNTVLAKNTDKRIKITAISSYDDFSEIPEGKFIEFCRSAKIISNDVRKILDQKLGIRNTAAHPASVTISDVKATDFIIDLVENVLLKYKL
ncbi:MAG: hypothetical protein AB2727_03955 [Candidatus Thiodiazotropha taylori]